MGAWGPQQGHQHWWVPRPAPRSPVISLGGLGPQNRADGLGETPLGMSGGVRALGLRTAACPACSPGREEGWCRGRQRRPGLGPGVRLAAWEQESQPLSSRPSLKY